MKEMREEYADLEEARVWTARQVGNGTFQSQIGSVVNGRQLAAHWKHKVASINAVSPYSCAISDHMQSKERADTLSLRGLRELHTFVGKRLKYISISPHMLTRHL